VIESVLKKHALEEVEEGIFSPFRPGERESSYDKKVNAYDMVIGNALYNRLIWGNCPSRYAAFCREALTSAPNGVYLDAGCGSLVFTAREYAEADNELIVLLDLSLGMLRKGRSRLKELCGSVPKNILFVQADIFDLPLHDRCVDTVASFGMLHVFEDQMGLLAELERVKKSSGHMFLSSLVGNNALARKYLAWLKDAGEVATCHTSSSLDSFLSGSPFQYNVSSIGNMAYIRSV